MILRWFGWLLELVLGCRHRRNVSRVFTDRHTHQSHVVCLDCGARRSYDWGKMK